MTPFRQTFKTTFPPQVLSFPWEATKECCLTIDNLRKRGKVLVNACYLRKRAVKGEFLAWEGL